MTNARAGRHLVALAVVLALGIGILLACGEQLPDLPADTDASSSDASTASTTPDAVACNADLATDPKNCGRCLHDCLGGACSNGVCSPVLLVDWGLAPKKCAAPQDASASNCFDGTLAGIAVDDAYVYFSDFTGGLVPNAVGGVLRVKKDVSAPTAPETVVLAGPVRNLAISSKHVYWHAGVMARAAKGVDGTTQVLTPNDPGSAQVNMFISDSESEILWATVDRVHRLRLDVADAGIQDVLDGGPGTLDAIFGLAAENDRVCWSTVKEIWLFERNTGNRRRVAIGQETITMAIKDGILYWANKDGTVYRADLRSPAGQLIPEKMGSTDVNPSAMVVDNDFVYIATWGPCANTACGVNGTIFRMPRTGNEHTGEVLHAAPQLPGALAMDDKALYWTTWWFKAVRRLAK